ncbi:hypothetical protein EPI10_029512 [Gossypium australe]|uniref:Uncharacterized protein n=1 Tax=Gossypium australe TaxID=47621 RepID=A0A5B6V1Q5_9ROSI|nr:hypothetical protein EPI10_029512 [Gossypium australe]
MGLTLQRKFKLMVYLKISEHIALKKLLGVNELVDDTIENDQLKVRCFVSRIKLIESISELCSIRM